MVMPSLPTQEQCLGYFEQYVVPKNIQAHCQAVQAVSVLLAERLKETGVKIDVEFIRPLSILHDLFKAAALKELNSNHKYHPYSYSAKEIAMWKELRAKYPGLHEGEIAYEVFKGVYPKLAQSLKNVSALGVHTSSKTLEENLVHYIDWRVLKTDIITLHDRLVYLREMYPQAKLRHEEEQEILDFEKELFSQLPFTPQDLKPEFEKQYMANNKNHPRTN